MKNQFVYTKKTPKQGPAGEVEQIESRECFNMEKVIRAVSMEDGRLMVLLDDLHERAQDVPVVDPRTNKIKEYRRQKDTYQSEIYLEGDDIERFFRTLGVV